MDEGDVVEAWRRMRGDSRTEESRVKVLGGDGVVFGRKLEYFRF